MIRFHCATLCLLLVTLTRKIVASKGSQEIYIVICLNITMLQEFRENSVNAKGLRLKAERWNSVEKGQIFLTFCIKMSTIEYCTRYKLGGR